MEAGNGSSRTNLSSVSSSIRAGDKTKSWLNPRIKKIGETGDPPITVATVIAPSLQTYKSDGDTSAATGADEVKLDVSQFNVAPGKATCLIYDPNEMFIFSTVRQAAALPASAPHNQLIEVPMSQSTPSSSTSIELPKLVLDKLSGDPVQWPSVLDSFQQQSINIFLIMVRNRIF